MTRKEYVKAAEIIAATNWDPNMVNAERERLANTFVKFFSHDNPKFNKARFLEACKLTA